MTELEDDTAGAAIQTASYLAGVAILSALIAVWMLGMAVYRCLRGEW